MQLLVEDITEQEQAYALLEQRVEERTQELSAILEVSHDVASTLELQPLLALILDRLKTVVDYTGAAVFLSNRTYPLGGGRISAQEARGKVSANMRTTRVRTSTAAGRGRLVRAAARPRAPAFARVR